MEKGEFGETQTNMAKNSSYGGRDFQTIKKNERETLSHEERGKSEGGTIFVIERRSGERKKGNPEKTYPNSKRLARAG